MWRPPVPGSSGGLLLTCSRCSVGVLAMASNVSVISLYKTIFVTKVLAARDTDSCRHRMNLVELSGQVLIRSEGETSEERSNVAPPPCRGMEEGGERGCRARPS